MAHEFGHAGHDIGNDRIEWLVDALQFLMIILIVGCVGVEFSQAWALVAFAILLKALLLWAGFGVFSDMAAELYADWFAMHLCDDVTLAEVLRLVKEKPHLFTNSLQSENWNKYRLIVLETTLRIRLQNERLYAFSTYMQRSFHLWRFSKFLRGFQILLLPIIWCIRIASTVAFFCVGMCLESSVIYVVVLLALFCWGLGFVLISKASVTATALYEHWKTTWLTPLPLSVVEE